MSEWEDIEIPYKEVECEYGVGCEHTIVDLDELAKRVKDLFTSKIEEIIEKVEEDVLAYDCPNCMASCIHHAAIEKQQNKALDSLSPNRRSKG